MNARERSLHQAKLKSHLTILITMISTMSHEIQLGFYVKSKQEFL